MRRENNMKDRSGFLIGLGVMTVCLQIVTVGFLIVGEIRYQRAMEALGRLGEKLLTL